MKWELDKNESMWLDDWSNEWPGRVRQLLRRNNLGRYHILLVVVSQEYPNWRWDAPGGMGELLESALAAMADAEKWAGVKSKQR